MTDAEAAEILRTWNPPYPDLRAARDRAIELLEREARMKGTIELTDLKRRDALDDGIVI